ncbi:GRAS protein [Tanacetum coccineum]
MSITSPSTLPVPHSSSPAPDSLSPSSLESQTLVATAEADRYQYEETVDPKEARKVWVRRAMERCRGTWAMVRIKCEKKSGSSNKVDWMNFCLEFVNVAANWDVILESWMKLEWMKRSKVVAENRKSVPGDVEATTSYVRHTTGSKSFRAHTHEVVNTLSNYSLDGQLEKRTGKQASKVHMFERLHKRNKGKGVWCDTRSEKVVTSHKESIKAADGVDLDSPDGVDLDSPSDIPFNSKAWEKAIGDPKKKNYYGHGITQDPKILHGHGTSVDSTPVNNEAIIEAQVIARVESRLEGVREETRAEMRKMFEDQQKTMSSNN